MAHDLNEKTYLPEKNTVMQITIRCIYNIPIMPQSNLNHK